MSIVKGRSIRAVIGAACLAVAMAACGGPSTPISGGSPTPASGGPSTPAVGTGTTTSSPSQSPASTEKPVPAESNPPGDIPDTQVFVAYRSTAGGFTIKVPEGWARKTTASSATFTSALNSIGVSWQAASSAPTAASARSNEVPQLQQSERAFTLVGVKAVTLSGGPSVLITYKANSAPNSVTGKQYRLDVLRFELFRNGTEGIITLSSPVGADNVDPWRIVSESFRWA